MNRNKVKIPPDVSVYLRYLYQDARIRGKALLRRFPQYSKTSIYRHAKKPIGELFEDKRHRNIIVVIVGTPRQTQSSERDAKNLKQRDACFVRHVDYLAKKFIYTAFELWFVFKNIKLAWA